MEKKHYFNTKMIATTGILVGIEILLQIIGNYINPGFANINLSLIPIVIGAVLYGPVVGGFLGLVCGVMVIISPSTMQIFFSASPVGTILACILKTTVAGVAAGLVVKLFKGEKKIYGVILASILVPSIKTVSEVIRPFLRRSQVDSAIISFEHWARWSEMKRAMVALSGASLPSSRYM